MRPGEVLFGSPVIGSARAQAQVPLSAKSPDVLGATRGLEEEVYGLELELGRIEALLRGTEGPCGMVEAPVPSALGERLHTLVERVRMTKITTARIIRELMGD